MNRYERLLKRVGPTWKYLDNKLVHMTHPDRFEKIIETGGLHPEPEGIHDCDRWSTRDGSASYPYVRHIGGVSLFDFSNFDAEVYEKACPMSNWYDFVPYRRSWGCAVWIDVEPVRKSKSYLSAKDVGNKQKSDKKHRHRLMPRIEAAHIGPIPTTMFDGAFLVFEPGDDIHKISIEGFDLEQYRELILAQTRVNF